MMNTTAHLGDDILNAWIDDVATPQEREIVQDHVATCDICQQRLNELRTVKAMFASLAQPTPPRSFQLTPEQARKPTPVRQNDRPSTIVRLLPIVRTLSVAAILAVMVLGGVLAFGPADDRMTSTETSDAPRSFQMQNPDARNEPAPGEVVDQGEAASAHDSTNDSLASEAQETAAPSDSGDTLSALEIATIALGASAMILGTVWIWMSMTIRSGASR